MHMHNYLYMADGPDLMSWLDNKYIFSFELTTTKEITGRFVCVCAIWKFATFLNL